MLSLGATYVAIETNCTERDHLSRAWIREVDAPFRIGEGWRVRLGHFAVQVGRCSKNPDVGEDVELYRQHMFMKWLPYPWTREIPIDDAPGEGHEERDRVDGVRHDERLDLRDDGVVEGRHLQEVQPERVGPGPDDAGSTDDGPSGPTWAEGAAEEPTEAAFDARVIRVARAAEEHALWQAIETPDRQGA